MTISQVGNNVQVSGSGTLNVTTLTLDTPRNYIPQINSQLAALISGVPCSNGAEYHGIKGPSSFGSTGNDVLVSSGGGSFVGVIGDFGDLYVPTGYVSGTALTTSSTYSNYTLASLGFTRGTYTYTWGTGATADSFVITSAVPEPSTWAMLGLGALGAGAMAVRRRRRVA